MARRVALVRGGDDRESLRPRCCLNVPPRASAKLCVIRRGRLGFLGPGAVRREAIGCRCRGPGGEMSGREFLRSHFEGPCRPDDVSALDGEWFGGLGFCAGDVYNILQGGRDVVDQCPSSPSAEPLGPASAREVANDRERSRCGGPLLSPILSLVRGRTNDPGGPDVAARAMHDVFPGRRDKGEEEAEADSDRPRTPALRTGHVTRSTCTDTPRERPRERPT